MPEQTATVRVPCERCGKEFETYKSLIKIGKGKYCSRSCVHKGETGDAAGAWKGGRSGMGGDQEYLGIRDVGHPRANNGYVLEHILIAEKALQKPLPLRAKVHHHNGEKKDNSNTNLVICQDQAYHMLLHRRQRVFARGGNPSTQKICSSCHKIKDKTEFISHKGNPDNLNYICRSCDIPRQRRRKICKRQQLTTL